MSVYIPLATKYRPQKFSDVIGQDIVIKIITRGMQKNRLGAALLFSGIRGIGKTTIARILAKAFRCEHADPEPCGTCEFCKEFAQGNQIDVIEIDAASNTGVDDVREIIESCRYKPTTGKYKIFIIDEVHMLSKSAFNALLKTLEEPPEHVKFMLATTETYKIPETILSRVLKFDLKKVDQPVITQYLSSICNRENIVADVESLSLIAKVADGSIRDGLSILDQAINMSEKNEISVTDVKDMLSISNDTDIVDLLELMLKSNVKETISKYRTVISGSVSANKLANTLLEYIYVLTCLKNNIVPLGDYANNDLMPKLKNIAEKVSIAALTKVWQMLLKGIQELKISDHQEIILEMIVVRIAYASTLPDLEEIIGEFQERGSINEGSVKSGSLKLNADKQNSVSGSLLDEALKMFPDAKVE